MYYSAFVILWNFLILSLSKKFLILNIKGFNNDLEREFIPLIDNGDFINSFIIIILKFSLLNDFGNLAHYQLFFVD